MQVSDRAVSFLVSAHYERGAIKYSAVKRLNPCIQTRLQCGAGLAFFRL